MRCSISGVILHVPCGAVPGPSRELRVRIPWTSASVALTVSDSRNVRRSMPLWRVRPGMSGSQSCPPNGPEAPPADRCRSWPFGRGAAVLPEFRARAASEMPRLHAVVSLRQPEVPPSLSKERVNSRGRPGVAGQNRQPPHDAVNLTAPVGIAGAPMRTRYTVAAGGFAGRAADSGGTRKPDPTNTPAPLPARSTLRGLPRPGWPCRWPPPHRCTAGARTRSNTP